MRRATATDEGFFYRLRNDAESRKWSKNTDVILTETHHLWFGRALRRDDLYVSDYGTVRVAKGGEVSVIVAPEHRGQGHAAKLLTEGLALANRPRYTAEIHARNVRSLVTFVKAGFVPYRMDGHFVSLRRS